MIKSNQKIKNNLYNSVLTYFYRCLFKMLSYGMRKGILTPSQKSLENLNTTETMFKCRLGSYT